MASLATVGTTSLGGSQMYTPDLDPNHDSEQEMTETSADISTETIIAQDGDDTHEMPPQAGTILGLCHFLQMQRPNHIFW